MQPARKPLHLMIATFCRISLKFATMWEGCQRVKIAHSPWSRVHDGQEYRRNSRGLSPVFSLAANGRSHFQDRKNSEIRQKCNSCPNIPPPLSVKAHRHEPGHEQDPRAPARGTHNTGSRVGCPISGAASSGPVFMCAEHLLVRRMTWIVHARQTHPSCASSP